MNKIAGKVVFKQSGIGIPNLLITIYDYDPDTKAEEIISIRGRGSTIINLPSLQALGDRIGSVLTNESGEFELSIEDSEFRIRNEKEKRPDYLLLVLAPEELGKDLNSRILYVSTKMIRQNAGRVENYIIRLTEEQLKKTEIEVPASAAEDTQSVINRIEAIGKSSKEIDDRVKEIQDKKLKVIQARAKTFDEKIKPELIKALSLVHGRTKITAEEPEVLIGAKNFVLQGQSVKQAAEKVIKEGIDNKFDNGTALTGFIGISNEKIQRLQELSSDDTGDSFEITEDEFNSIIFKIEQDEDSNQEPETKRSTILLKDDPIAKLCSEKTLGEICLQEAEDEDSDSDEGAGETDSEEVGGNGIATVTGDDIPKYIASLINPMTSPEESVSFGAHKQSKRANQADIQNNVDALQFRAGPADVVSFHDFHNLQIAFEHVWQEAIDEEILKLAEDAYKDIVELGGDPAKNLSKIVTGKVVDFVNSLRVEVEDLQRIALKEPPFIVIQAFEISIEQWNALNQIQQSMLEHVSGGVLVDDLDPLIRRRMRQQGERYIAYAEKKLGTGSDRFDNLHKILEDLSKRIKEDYPFSVYAANRQERSVNFGIFVTYRQKWEPISYQAGELAHTQTLAPNESRKFSMRTVVKKKRSEREVEKSLFSRKEESAQKSRSVTEILRNAQTNTNFNITSENTINYGVYGGTHTVNFGGDASKTSNEVKKSFRETVFKSAEEYKKERVMEVTTEEAFEEEFTEAGELINPNDELPVTFLFYELQRRYRISEHIHQLTPVVLVAQEMPKPNEIDEDWIIAHDWILKRVLLDDSFIPAINYLSTRVVGDEIALKEMKKNVEQQRKIRENLKDELVSVRAQVTRLRIAVERAIEERANIIGGEDGLLDDVKQFGENIIEDTLTGGGSAVARFFGFGGGDDNDEDEREAARIRQDAARDSFERTLNEEKKLLGRLEREVTALNEVTDAYTKLLSIHLNQRNQILRLRLHLKQNIFFYMQAIWSHEPGDQRFFRLHKVQVPTLKGKRKYKIRRNPINETPLFQLPRKGVKTHTFRVSTTIETNGGELETVDLVEVADLDNLLGYKGNYMIFPLIKANALTDFMMQPYLDNAFGDFMSLHDPDEFGNFSLEDFSKFVCCLKEEKPEEFEDLKDELKETFEKLITSPLRNREEIIVPTGSLFIEALPGTHAILEDFKLIHRAIDVKQVQAEVRAMELENIRAAARLIAAKDDTSLLDDPDIESVKRVFVSGDDIQANIDVGDDS